MRCLMCEEFSLTHICSSCQTKFLTPSLYKRKLPNNIEILSFYKYEDIKELLYTKHTDLGFYIYTLLAKNSFAKFTEAFEFEERVVSIGVDDSVKSGYSHTAILNKYLASSVIKPLYGKLRAKNSISYAGKKRAFRFQNPRDFQLKKFQEKNVILVDDIITTGATLTQAIDILQRANKEVILCLTLCDVSQK